jgi:acetyl-CoA carboxylase biotin carboxyl carrier protein
MDIRKVKKLIELVENSGIDELEIREAEEYVRICRRRAPEPAAPGYPPANVLASAPAPPAMPSEVALPEGHVVTSPMVGTAYLSPEPGAGAFVSVGDRVTEGQTLLIVEAMKTMNHIPSPRAGTVKRVLVEDGAPVEFGAPLMVVE